MTPGAAEVTSAGDRDRSVWRARQTVPAQYAIVGMAARFPGGSNSPSAFWKVLKRGDPCIGSLSASRLSWPPFIDPQGAHAGIDRACLLDNVAAQDMAFFGISAREAELMDPQQRILMELSWETFESSGQLPSTYNGSSTGVFIGVCHSDYRELMAAQARTAEAYVGTGNIPCMLANRISYYYNFKGPSFTVDTACSSALFAVSQAVSAIERGECQQALVGAVNLILTPTSSVAYYQAGMLSSSTTCNPFDDESDGYIRGEGAGMILVKTLEQARRDHDHVLAVIKGVAVNHGGKARSLTAPNALSQAQVITAALEQAEVPVSSVNYIEAHGTGTPLGDPIEILGMTRSFARLAKQQNVNLPRGHCAIGAVKGCIGHSEAAAGMASIIKVVLAMQHRYLPPNVRLRNINRRIELDDSPFYLPQEGREWRPVTGADGRPLPLRAGISCFGFGGTNSHLLLESADTPPLSTPSAGLQRPMLFGLSAKNDARLMAYARQYDEWLSGEQAHPVGLEQLSRTLLMGREAMPRRLAIVADSVSQLVGELRAFVEGRPGAASYIGPADSSTRWTEDQLQSMLGARDLSGLATAWTQGQLPDWSALFDRDVKNLPFVPTYPFDRKPFWVPWRSRTEADNSARRAPIHALLQENISNFRRQAYRSVFTPQHPLVSGHRVAGHRVLPATAFLVMAHYAVADALALKKDSGESGLVELTDVRWLQPFAIDRQPEPLELHLSAARADGFQFEFLRPQDARVCVGNARLRPNTANPRVDLDACRNVAGAVRLSGDECYEYYAQIGLDYRDDYRVIEHIEVSDGLLIAQIAISDNTEDPLPAQLLDGALQSAVATVLAQGTSPPPGELVMPAEAAFLQVFAPCTARMWSVIRLDPDQGEKPLCQFDVDLCNDQGIVCVRIGGVRLARLAAGRLERSLAILDSADTASSFAASEAAAPAESEADPGVLFEAVRRDLKQLLAQLLRVSERDLGDDQSFSECGVDSLLVVSLIRQINSRWQCKLTPTVIYEFPRVDLLARHIVGLGSQAITQTNRSAPAAISGDSHRAAIRAADVAPVVPAARRFLADPSRAQGSSAHRAVVLSQPSQLDELSIVAVTPGSLEEQDVLIGVRAFSLNFGDLLCIRGLYPSMPAYPFTPGFEASGVIVQVGAAVTSFRVGDEVVGLAGQALGAHANVLVCHSGRVFRKPPNLRFEEACALPVVCLTVLDAFAKAQPCQGERILIQSAAGGLGLAAVQLAQHYGLEIVATAGSEQRLQYLQALGIRHLINYRDSDFEQEVRRITAGQGVDIVLNTLPGDAIQKGLNVLRPGGRYVEMAMTALKSARQVDLSVLSDNQALFSVDLRKLSLQRPQRLQEYLHRMLELHALGVFRPVIAKEFPFDRYREACDWLSARNSVGKVIVSIPTGLQIEAARTSTAAAAAVTTPAAAVEGIAIIGMSGRFAESDNVQQLWQHLACGRDLVKPVTRWDLSSLYASRARAYCNHGSFLREIDTFDSSFFGISGVEARHMDPQQRIFLEEAWRALEDAGCAVDRLRGKACGVFVGCTEGDYHYLFDEDAPAQSFWGNALSVVPARVAYHLDLRGPAVAVDTACSSSLVALHQACQSLWLNEVDVAIAGGVYIQSTARLYLSSERADMLSHRGRCHSFGARADGFVPGEGVGAIVLKRLSKALEDRDHIYGVIRGSGIGQDGATNGITAPSQASQCSLQSGIYRKFGIDPARIQMVEAHGTGTALGDPIEFEALTRSFGEFTSNRQFCALGSIKSNIGHLAPAAGIAGVIKVLLSMQHRQIPPTLHSVPSNPQLQFENSPFYLSNSLRAWPPDGRGKRAAAISSFGFSGTNAHVVIEDYEAASVPSAPRAAYLVVLSAKSLQQLKSMAGNLADTVAAQATDCGHLSFTLLTGRTHLSHRLATVVPDAAVLVDRLRGWVERGEHAQVLAGECDPNASQQTPGKGVDAATDIPDASRYAEYLVALARAFVRGGHPAFENLFSSGYFHKLSLPTYPFARTRCWVQAKGPRALPASPPGRASLHPLVHSNISTLQRHLYGSYFSGTESFFADHRVGKKPVLPGVAYLEMATVAAALALQADPQSVQLEDVYWLRPLVGNEPVSSSTEVVQTDGALRFEVRNASDEGQGPYCKGTARIAGPRAGESAKLELDSRLAEGGWQRFDAVSCYDEYARRGIDYGDSHRLLQQVWVNRAGTELLARVAMPVGARRETAFTLDPGLSDAALQALLGFELVADKPAASAHELLLPYSLQSLVRYRPLPAQLLVRATRRPGAEPRLFDLDIHDREGVLCLQLQGLQVVASTHFDAVSPGIAPVAHDPEVSLVCCWQRISLESALDPTQFGRQKTVSIGLDAVCDEELRRLCPTRHKLQLTPEDTVEKINAGLAECPGIEHVVLGFLDADPVALPGDEMIGRQYRAVLFLLRLIKALIAQGYDAKPLTCTILTRQAQALSKQDPIDPALASIHGMVGSLAKECPGWRLRLLDMDRPDGLIAALPGVPFDSMGNALLYRGGHWYRQELRKCELDEADPSGFREGGAYVIVGGAGGLGEFFSEYLIQRYRARIVWIGRSALDDRIERKLDRLARSGNRPVYLAADAGSQTEMMQALAKVQSTLGVVHGVIHSALVLRDKTLASMQEAELTAALAAKVDAAVRIAQIFAARTTDFVLFFSSANSFFKAPGQGNYVAGCVFEDALAVRLSQIARCQVNVINWGYWGTTGAVANETVARRMRAYGIGSIVPDRAVRILERLIAGPVDQLVYLATTQPLTTLGVPVSARAPAALEDVNGIVRRAFAALPDISPDGSRERLEPCLLPLLWAQIKRSGLVALQHSSSGTIRCYRVRTSRFDRWLTESQRWLAANSLIELRDGVIYIDEARDVTEPDWQGWDQLLRQYARDTQTAWWSVLVDEALRALPDVLQERQPATEVLFPGGSMALVEGVYRDDPVAHFFNEAVASLVAQYLDDRARASKGSAVRILELGAGTGATSERVLARLNASRLEVAEYCFTDISKAFLLHAQERYGSQYRYLTYDIVNIERAADIAAHLGKYDLVIAVKVLHATQDIEQTLRNAKSLLKPGGLLVINEISQHTLMMHLTFGLLDGWWLYQDSQIRMPGGPGIPSGTWNRLLLDLGFPHVYLPLAHLHSLGYQIIVAQSDGAQARQTIGVPDNDTAQKSIETSGSLELDKAVGSRQLLERLQTVAASVLEIDRGELDSLSRPFGEAVLGHLGLDSLLSTNLRSRLLKDPGVDIPVQTLVGEKISAIIAEMQQQLLLQQISQSRSQAADSQFETHVF